MATTHCCASSAPVKASLPDPDPEPDPPCEADDDVTAVNTVSVVQEPAGHADPFHSAVLVMFPDGSDVFAVTLKVSV